MFAIGAVRANESLSGGIIGIFFSIILNMKVCCVFSLESPYRGSFPLPQKARSVTIGNNSDPAHSSLI